MPTTPTSTDNGKRRYPFVVSEIFRAEVKEILDLFFVPYQPPTIEAPSSVLKTVVSEVRPETGSNPPSTSNAKSDAAIDATTEAKTASSMMASAESKGEQKKPEGDKAPGAPLSSGPVRFGLLERLLSLLKGPEQPNIVLVGYMGKVLQGLLNKRKADLLKYLFSYKEHMAALIKHSFYRSIADLLPRILCLDDGPVEVPGSFSSCRTSSIDSSSCPQQDVEAVKPVSQFKKAENAGDTDPAKANKQDDQVSKANPENKTNTEIEEKKASSEGTVHAEVKKDVSEEKADREKKKEELEQKHLHLLQIVESEKTAKWQYTRQCEELTDEIKQLRTEVQ